MADEITPIQKGEVLVRFGGPVDESRATLAIYGDDLQPDDARRCIPNARVLTVSRTSEGGSKDSRIPTLQIWCVAAHRRESIAERT